MSVEQRRVDVSGLPSVVFGHHSIMWWGTLGFMLIEGFTLVLMMASYLYLRMNELDWPPGRTPDPDLIVPTINTILLLVVIVPLQAADRASRAFDRQGVIRALASATALSALISIMRWPELLALNVRFDAHAYASAAWATVLLHGTLVVADFLETGLLLVMFLVGRATRKHYTDVGDALMYQWFLSLIWLPIYFLVYWSPRLW